MRGERAFLAHLRAQARCSDEGSRGAAVRLGMGDDCAILRIPANQEVVVTTDLFLEKVHFRRDWHQPGIAGHRCLARGLSDIAAMGATPVAIFLSLAIPPDLAGDWVRRFVRSLLRLGGQHGAPLAGGDTAQAPANADGESLFSADIVVVGSVPAGKALLRSGARAGDALYVTGRLGGAAAELELLAREPARFARVIRCRAEHPHLFPAPRIESGIWLRGRASAAIDVSDGLSTDLAHLCEESGVAAEVEVALLPVHPLARRAAPASEPLALALHGGEDYELLFTAPARRRIPPVIAATEVHRIGSIVEARRGSPRVTLRLANGACEPLRNGGWEHFITP